MMVKRKFPRIINSLREIRSGLSRISREKVSPGDVASIEGEYTTKVEEIRQRVEGVCGLLDEGEVGWTSVEADFRALRGEIERESYALSLLTALFQIDELNSRFHRLSMKMNAYEKKYSR